MLTGMIFVAGGTSAVAEPTAPPPSSTSNVPALPPGDATAADVTAALRALAEQNEALAEQLNAAQIDLDAKRAVAAEAQANAQKAAQKLATMKTKLNQTALNRYLTGNLNHAATLLTSDSADAYLTSSAALDFLWQRQTAQQIAYDAAANRATAAQTQAVASAAGAQRVLDDLTRRRADLDARQATYEKTLATLTAAQRSSYFGPSAPTPNVASGPAPAPNPRAQAAVNFAMAQLGKPYVFAAAGPSSFDCSGLTMAAWAQAGITLPHFARSQFGMGTHIGAGDLKPGDLVFFYADLHHVGIYIGDGNMVHAPTPGDVVKVVSIGVFGSDYMGAVRLS